MVKFRPRSILQLILMGYFVVFFPIGLSIYQAMTSLDELAKKNQENILTAVLVTRNAQKVTNLSEDMERSLLQYELLGSENILTVFKKKQAELVRTLIDLEKMFPPPLAGDYLNPYNEKFLEIKRAMTPPVAIHQATPMARELTRLSREVNQGSKIFADEIISDTHKLASIFQDKMILQSFLVIPATLLLVFFFSTMIARPFRQIHKGILRLGHGQFDKPVMVKGPRDIAEVGTKLAWLGERLQELEEQKQAFLRHMSHELKTPLAALKEGGELLSDQIPGELNERQKEVVQIIMKATQFFQKEIENLLDYNLLRSQTDLIIEPIALKKLMTEILNRHCLTIQRKEIQIRTPETDCIYHGDKRRLEVSLDNLISNAIHFTRRKGTIELKWSMSKAGLTIQVIDSGPGLDPKEMDSIFTPFYQGSARRDGPLKGSGIGLSIAMECIKAHQGRLRAFNREEKNGAVFEINLPLQGKETLA